MNTGYDRNRAVPVFRVWFNQVRPAEITRRRAQDRWLKIIPSLLRGIIPPYLPTQQLLECACIDDVINVAT